jgi:hypothetical protein
MEGFVPRAPFPRGRERTGNLMGVFEAVRGMGVLDGLTLAVGYVVLRAVKKVVDTAVGVVIEKVRGE